MTGEELAGKIKDEISEDERLHAILDRIREGKATLTDSELYAAITARITAQQMRRNVLSLEKREAAFVGITHERYTDTFTVFSAVQRILDAQNGIHIRPKAPGFDTGRARKIGHSLEDQTVPDSTIERRARSATENFCMSHHDDCMRVNAEFRARAGLQSYAIRDGSAKCCDWCADVSGKYPANETPAGFWGRHDNCKCSIIYESKRSGRQLLRGTSKKWEVVPENAGAEPLVRLTKEQAMQIQQEKQLHRMTPGEVVNNPLRILTNGVKNVIIESEGVKPMIHSIEHPIEQKHTGKGNPNAILTFDIELNNRQSRLLEQLPEFDSRVIVPKSSVNMTDLSALTAKTGHEFAMFTKGQERLIIRGDVNSVNIDIDTARQLSAAGYRWSGHTHPGDSIQSMIASGGDMLVLEQFQQSTSVIYNSKGQYATFGKEE